MTKKLNSKQKKYLKKHLRKKSIKKIASFLNIDENGIQEYLKKSGGRKNIKGFSKKGKRQEGSV